MSEWNDYFSILRCINCSGSLRIIDASEHFSQYPCINGELICLSCGRSYPVFQGIPILFKDEKRFEALTDSVVYEVCLNNAKEKMKQASLVAGNELGRFKEEREPLDALSWEILFWERWKQSDEDFLDYERAKIEKYLEGDNEGGGRLKFFRRVMSFCHVAGYNVKGKRLLNIGAGRDFLLEKFLDEGWDVVEQDIILESLLLLKKRGASFCVCSDARFLPFASNIFDVTTSFEVLHHIWPIEYPIAELLRVTCGNVHFNEPNYFALTRIALLLPGSIKRWLKNYYSGNLSHSPYEDSINPYLFRKIVKSNFAEIIDLSFMKSSWISNRSKGMKKVLRLVNLLLANLFPLVSSHFDSVVKKKNESMYADKSIVGNYQEMNTTVTKLLQGSRSS